MSLPKKAKAKDGFRERVAVLSSLRPSVPDEVCQIARSFRRKEVAWDDIADAFVAALTRRSHWGGCGPFLPLLSVTDAVCR